MNVCVDAQIRPAGFTALLFALAFLAAPENVLADDVDFNRDVRPILSDKCFHCHGPDANNQDSEFRVDSRENAIADLGGYAGIVPGDLEASELHARIHETGDLDHRMPPQDSKLSLTDQERETLDQWIREGAVYDKHWAFKRIARPKLPTVEQSSWPANELDHFVLKRLESEGQSPSQPAERERLLRRVTLDLTGLPPTLQEIEAFLNDHSDSAWERVVDRLLASEAYGEHMALAWLEAARYADSGGYQNDTHRTQWPWRDWVIQSFNKNKPFDEFTIEQLAGDLLDDPTDDQLLATAFNRNHRINNEAGIIAEEFRVEYVADRVETTSTVWLGLTVGCARCHDHKYDPIKMKDFYSLFAFFNQVPENGRDESKAPRPNLRVLTGGTKAELEQHEKAVRQFSDQLKHYVAEHNAAFEQWLAGEIADKKRSVAVDVPAALTHVVMHTAGDYRLYNARQKSKAKQPVFVGEGDDRPSPATTQLKGSATPGKGLLFHNRGYIRMARAHGESFDARQPQSWVVRFRPPEKLISYEGPLLTVMHEEDKRGYRISLQSSKEDRTKSKASLEIIEDGKSIDVVSKEPIVEYPGSACLVITSEGNGAEGVRFYVDGEEVETEILSDNLDWTDGQLKRDLLIGARSTKDADDGLRGSTFRYGVIEDVQIYVSVLDAKQVRAICDAPPHELLLASYSDAARETLRTHYFIDSDPAFSELRRKLGQADDARQAFEEKAITMVSVMQDRQETRETFVLDRGVYDKPIKEEPLGPKTLSSLPAMAPELPRNRLGLAKWLVDPSHPLTARVAVNRFWQNYFGRGLVATQEDFGSQGALPTHPDLLDWLASSFIESGWDIKALQKQIVMSATYQQSSRVTPELLQRDPKNELLARASRFRLSGQAIRDQALAVSGLLCETSGGPPVMPYQPAGLWDEVSAKGYKYIVGDGDDLYRRSLYTFWRRTVPPPSMMNFDNPTREMCSVRMSRTNTPLQALNLMNDPQFLEASRCFAQQMILGGGENLESRVSHGHRRLLSREPNEATWMILRAGHERYTKYFDSHPDAASDLISVGQSLIPEEIESKELAAMTLVASILLNLDETVTRE